MGPVRTSTVRWTVFFTLVATFILIAFMAVPGTRYALAQGDESTTPTATGARDSLNNRPTATATEEIPEFFLTLTAVEPTYASQPTATPGISALARTGKPHFVDFNAYWCVPCNEMRPFLADLEKKYEERITFDDVNIDSPQSQRLAGKYQVQFIPLMVLLDKDLKNEGRLEGYQDAKQVEAALKKLLNIAEPSGDSAAPDRSF